MRFFQRALDGTNSYCECERKHATYFQNVDGDFLPVGQLLINNTEQRAENREVIVNVPVNSGQTPDPLPLPVMNFGDEQVVDNSGDYLPLPSMNFEPKQPDQKIEVDNNDVGYLPLPSLG